MTERRRRPITLGEWRSIATVEGFWRLAEAGYLSYRQAGPDRRELVGAAYVGRALTDDLEIQVREKVPGTLRALIGAATGADLRIETAESPATDFDMVSRHLMGEFVGAARRYAAERRRPRFAYRDAKSPVLAGSLDMPATMLLHATGRPGVFAYREGGVVRDEPLDRLVLAALYELDRAGPALGLDSSTLYDARWLAGALGEVRDERFLATPVADFLETGDGIERDPARAAEDVDLARLSVVVLLHRGFEPELPGDGEVPRAWFIDLEMLFERAVRETLRELLPAHDVDLGKGYERRMFTGGTDTSRTNPDIVVHGAGRIRAAGDVKYKALRSTSEETAEGESLPRRGRKEGRSDLYQLLVHAASLSAARAFLIYAGDEARTCRYLGLASTGCHTWVAQVRPSCLREDLRWFLSEIGLAEEPRS